MAQPRGSVWSTLALSHYKGAMKQEIMDGGEKGGEPEDPTRGNRATPGIPPLHPELWRIIINHLEVRELYRACQVCKAWRGMASIRLIPFETRMMGLFGEGSQSQNRALEMSRPSHESNIVFMNDVRVGRDGRLI